MNLHKPVLITKILKFLPEKKDLIIFDGTFGGGGYSKEFLKLGHKVYACDLDGEVIEKEKLKKNTPNLILTHSSFSEYIQTFEENFFNVLVLDLGFSSNQLESSNRGFSYQKSEEILDLRYNNQIRKPCWEKIKNLKKPEEFFKTIYRYSGESFSPAIAKILFTLIRSKPNSSPEVNVGEVVEAIKQVIPQKFQRNLNAILSRTWQALRIWTNDEFYELELFLKEGIKKLKKDGLLMVVSFHSLEDKIVGGFMRDLSKPIEISEFGDKERKYELLTAKVVTPDEDEINENPRSRSALLRVLKKL